MRFVLPVVMGWMLLHPGDTMAAASAACRLFVTSVLPGLFPYMVLSLMLTSRCGGRMPTGVFLLLGWGGGSPTGARLLPMVRGSRKQRVRLAVSCATMSPMFLLGTIGAWLQSSLAGAVVLGSVLISGAVTGALAGACTRGAEAQAAEFNVSPLSFGAAVEQAARTMLIVCGTMVMLRVLSGIIPLPGPFFTGIMEVTTGVEAVAQAPWPLAWRTAIIAGLTSFGGMASIMQNRAAYGEGVMSLAEQVAWQAVHGAVGFLLALGAMCLA